MINSKFPPISLFDDVADSEEFETLYALQALTNPRLQNEVGNLTLLPSSEIPFGIQGCSYAAAPFTHVNPEGSRFSDGSFGVLYLADSFTTAIAEVKYHQQRYWSRVPELRYERFVFRGLKGNFGEAGLRDAQTLPSDHPIYHPDDYREPRLLGSDVRKQQDNGIRYHSVRQPSATCWALMTPRCVTSIIQTAHLEMIWNGSITDINWLTSQE
ncbi:RES family NAD+ phosphorylase [Halomonas sp. PR-M31]|uniref:RES family NAD+ phosphorylase n=1 Tax=Halomonas sp. PR-M31 TaxID=1471202 RepID=UPI00345F342F